MSEPIKYKAKCRARYALKPTHLLAIPFVGLAIAATGCGGSPTSSNQPPPPSCPFQPTPNCIPNSSPPDQNSIKDLQNRYDTWLADHQYSLTFHEWRVEILR